MSNLKKFGISESSVLHLRDANDELMYADGEDGKPDQSRPMRVHLHGPGSKVHAKARQAAANRTMDRFKKKGKSDLTYEDQIAETATFLTACTEKWENVEYDGLTGDAMSKAIYSDLSLIFLAKQVDGWLAETSNFAKPASTS